MSVEVSCSAEEALRRLRAGNEKYLQAETGAGDISPRIRLKTSREGQKPIAVVITCSDSRVIPESIFSAGIGDLFVIRVAGNVMDNHQLGSVEYAVDHLGTRLVVVLGHTQCGAVNAAIHHNPEGYVKYITDEISRAIGDETDDFAACCKNVRWSVDGIRNSIVNWMKEYSLEEHGLVICGAVYHIEDGRVEFLPDACELP